MASSSQIVDQYVVDGYMDDGYTVTSQELTVELVSANSTVSGVATRQIDAESTQITTTSTVSGTAERTVLSSGSQDLSSGNSTVTGSGDREFLTSAQLSSQSSSVDGTAERGHPAENVVLTSDDSTVSVQVERTIVAENIEIVSGPITILATASYDENVVETAIGELESGASTVIGASTRTINASGAIEIPQSTVAGTGFPERKITGELVSGDPIVAGVAFRKFSGSLDVVMGDITLTSTTEVSRKIGDTNLVSGDSTVIGTTESASNATGELQQSSQSIVTGAAELIKTASGQLETTPVEAYGIALRTITGSGTLVSGDSITVGTADNIMTGSGVLVAGPSTVNGVGDQTPVAIGNVKSQDATTTALAERKVVSSGVLVSGDPVVTLLAEREIQTSDIALTTGSSVVNGAAQNDQNVLSGITQVGDVTVAGVAERKIVMEDVGLTAGEIGFSAVAGVGENIIVSGDGSLESGQAIVNGEGVAGRKAFPIEITNTDSIVIGAGEREIDYVSGLPKIESQDPVVTGVVEITTNGTGQLTVAFPSTVAGVAERSIVGINTELDAGEIGFSAVAGTAENIIVSGDGTVESGPSIVTAEIGRDVNLMNGEILSESSTVVGGTKRTSNGSGVVVSGQSTVNGLAENGVNALSTDLVSGDAIVIGATQITANGTGSLLNSSESIVAGTGERHVIMKDVGLTAGEVGIAAVAGTAERSIITGDGTLETGPSIVTSVNEKSANVLEGITQIPDVLVDGLAERTITGSAAITTEITLTCNAEREIINDVDITQDESIVSGVGERTVNLILIPNKAKPAEGNNVAHIGDDILVKDLSTNPNLNGLYVLTNKAYDLQFSTGERRYQEAAAFYTYELVADTNPSRYNTLIYSVYDSAWMIVYRTPNSVQTVAVGDAEAGASGPYQLTTASFIVPSNSGTMSQSSTLAGVGERTVFMEDVGITADEVSVVAVVAQGERVVVSADGSIESGQSVVTGLGDRQSDLEGDAIVSQDASVSGITERVVVNIPNHGDAGPFVSVGPNDDGPSLTYVDEYNVKYPTNGNVYTVLIGEESKYVDVELNNFVSRVTTAGDGDDKNIYWRISGNLIDCIFFNYTVGKWYRKEFNTHPSEWEDGTILSPTSALNTVEETSKAASRPGNLSSRLYSSDAYVLGVSENIHEAYPANIQGEITLTASIGKVSRLPIIFNYEMPDAIVNGLGEREIREDDQLVTTPSLVTGSALRHIDVEQPVVIDSQSAIVDGLAERIVDHDGLGQQLYSGSSTVNATTKVSTFLQSGIAQVSPSTVVGVAENIIPGQGDIIVSAPSIVAGVAEREMRSGVNLITTESIVTGVAERSTTNDADNLVSGDSIVIGSGVRHSNALEASLDTTPSLVVGEAEDQHDADDVTLFSGDSIVNGVVERTVVRLPDFMGPPTKSPDSNDSNVSYDGTNLVVVNMLGHLAFYNGKYVQMPLSGKVEESGANYKFVETDFGTSSEVYNYYTMRSLENGGYFVAYFFDPDSEWKISFTTTNPATWVDQQLVAGLSGTQVTLATASMDRSGSFSSMKGVDSIVSGVAEREEVLEGDEIISQDSTVNGSGVRHSNSLEATVESGQSSVNSTIKRTINPVDIHLTAGEVGLSSVTGDGERKVILLDHIRFNTDDADVVGVAERTIVGVGAVISAPSSVAGEGHRTSVDPDTDDLKSQPSTIVGVAEREIKSVSADLKIIRPYIYDKGEAERVIVSVDASIKSDDSSTNGNVNRKITNVPDPQLGETRLYAGNNRPWQQQQTRDLYGQPAVVKPRVANTRIFQSEPIILRSLPVSRKILIRDPRPTKK